MRREDPHHFLFYCPDLGPAGERAQLNGDEHAHLTRVLRMRPGESAYVTDGRGAIFRCEVQNVDKRTTDLLVQERIERPPTKPVTLALACLKKDAFEIAVRLCTELGITTFLPFQCEKAHLRGYSPNFLDRLRRIALGAMKQSFRPTLPVIEPAVDFDKLLLTVGDHDTAIVGDADGETWEGSGAAGRTLTIVGPEAGFSAEEQEQLRAAGCTFVKVSANRLRAETAAAALATLILSTPGNREA